MNKHIFVFNPSDNSGEHLILETNFLEDEEGDVFLNQTLTLNSYLNCATMELSNWLNPENLRRLADELEMMMPPKPESLDRYCKHCDYQGPCTTCPKCVCPTIEK